MSLVADFATCTERSAGPVRRRGNMFEMRRSHAPLGAHGLSFLVEIGDARDRVRGLFDCGLRPDALAQNLDYFGLDVASVDALILSHGHPDHFGGLETVAARLRRARQRVPLIHHPAVFRSRRWVWPDLVGGRYRLDPASLARLAPWIRPEPRAGSSLILGGAALFLTEIPRRVAYEAKRPGGQVQFLAGRRWEIDTTPDDGAIAVHLEGRGLVILTGCGHAGLINTVNEAIRRTGVDRIHAIVGGFHLCGASARRIGATVRDLTRLGPRWIVPSHCSGLTFEAALERAFPRGFILDSVGSDYVFER
jgi:7,8-dihydropterin-6-yl-methyl-4-(beta-D-ribofuranosyl)aminobenzene 5'-phosphate synthase